MQGITEFIDMVMKGLVKRDATRMFSKPMPTPQHVNGKKAWKKRGKTRRK